MSTTTADLNSKIAYWRQRAAEGLLTLEEMREAIQVLRGGRVGAAIASATSKEKKAPMQVINADDLLEGL